MQAVTCMSQQLVDCALYLLMRATIRKACKKNERSGTTSASKGQNKLHRRGCSEETDTSEKYFARIREGAGCCTRPSLEPIGM